MSDEPTTLDPGGVLSLTGANSGAGLRRISRRVVMFDAPATLYKLASPRLRTAIAAVMAELAAAVDARIGADQRRLLAERLRELTGELVAALDEELSR